jgi:hypothetical protein
VWDWLRRGLGFSYEPHKKTFYVDGHELPAQRFDRKMFVLEHMKMEQRMHCWIQSPKSFIKEKIEEGSLHPSFLQRGYHYNHSDGGEEMMEFHVDDDELFFEKANDETEYGGWLSKRFPDGEKVVIQWGQDECAFAQHSYSTSEWVMDDGQRTLRPKSDGFTLMISAFQSREFGFGPKLLEEELNRMNAFRAGKHYKDEEAAKEVNQSGTTEKMNFTESPFVKLFETGANADGYWNYNQMAVQLEDVMDCCSVLWPQYDHVFLFDSSSGHKKKRPDGLDAGKMNSGYGGVQPHIRDSKIVDQDGYLGPFDTFVADGDTQIFDFRAEDTGPFWLTPEQREESRHDRPKAGATPKERSKQELYCDLLAAGERNLPKHINKISKDNLVERARAKGIPLEKTPVDEGWEGKPKGLLQILWERGWIDETQVDRYRLETRDEDGKIVEEFSLRAMMESCLDFAVEETQLQKIACEYGFKVVYTPKFHAEIAGVGIEYSWGASKSHYRRIPQQRKRTKDLFFAAVRESLAILSKKTVRKCARRARHYVQAYYVVEVLKKTVDGEDLENATQAITLPMIEKLSKAFKSHRSAIDFDGKFIRNLLEDLLEDLLEEEQN